MRRSFILTLAALLTLGLLAGGVLAQGPGGGQGQGHGPPVFDAAEITIVSSGDHGPPSSGYSDDANIVDTLVLDEGDWKVTASGAVEVGDSATAPNCGLRLDDADGSTMIGKQNFADGGFKGRSGFAVTGAALNAADGDEVHLICYGTGGNAPFEHNLVAIGGS